MAPESDPVTLQKPNVYLDLSGQDLLFPPPTEAQWLQEWLEFEPEKVLFGTDGYPCSDELSWAESSGLPIAIRAKALGIALTRMVREGEISHPRALEVARLVLRGNAERLYRFTSEN